MVFGQLSRRLRPTEAGLAADLTPTRVAVLLNTVRNAPIRLAEVAEQEGLNPTLLSRTVANLAQDGLVTRTADEADRRSAWLDATPAGRELAERIRAQRTHAVQVALEQLAVADRNLVEAALPALEQLAQRLHEGGR
ncbi:MAG TPA: MarR family transcriptional regulator [Solirubrobacteraceae bacterium]|jgi:DNA-binding MarR family transcriptional regulator|nr:MarR family transcriptional regulator [Solirubrobacteraceae bacterium]